MPLPADEEMSRPNGKAREQFDCGTPQSSILAAHPLNLISSPCNPWFQIALQTGATMFSKSNDARRKGAHDRRPEKHPEESPRKPGSGTRRSSSADWPRA